MSKHRHYLNHCGDSSEFLHDNKDHEVSLYPIYTIQPVVKAVVTGADVVQSHTIELLSSLDYRKLMMLPPFHEKKDDLDAYLNRFERTCRALNVPQGQWSFQLARFLQGQALDVYQRMTGEDVSAMTC